MEIVKESEHLRLIQVEPLCALSSYICTLRDRFRTYDQVLRLTLASVVHVCS